MLSAFEFITSRRRDGDRRRGAVVLVAALAVFVVALTFSTSSAYGATAKPPTTVAKTKLKPKVKAFIHRGQLNVLGTAANDKITLRLKPGNQSRLQVDVGSNGSAEFTFKRSAFRRIVVHTRPGSDAMTIDESHGPFTNTEATSLFGDAGSDLVVGRARTQQRSSSSRVKERGSGPRATATRIARPSNGSTSAPWAERTTWSSTT